ncbi:bifunctional hydroxymethylpyrimidine kinase/phosphomethylpyrimidine kinase [Notoacmeibacter sp. MSK16QG-6]|uniref:bifunctional hydroxymethylpyrimidine kinase/phosphomethylpyrimidine kinase n=1 Tax=Notoacmeibacter sp. MSK16QG-6 TaxID=2957982 RepID=UPI00209D930A|nr:bifunctional hydroxymethylpyrimidine kinase/phosphomethylpyrimidine kinase [Notoacmeibacter sp. MSK16QG-6]MCP1199750.1 bifunctional hydroxymethylpyrimidine kinase/phosphomethylpyrimidine kinase [Notoacmeibacter sp. MSK16QG-6]
MTKRTPTALTIAGSDSGGGAGIQADLKTFSALGVYGASAITAITAQNTQAVTMVEVVSPKIVSAQIEAVLSDITVDAIKIGMLGTSELTRVVAEAIAGFEGPVVLDPVMVAKSGDRLLDDDAVSAMRKHLLPLATLLTPNLPEAAALTDSGEAGNLEEMEEQARQLLGAGCRAVLVKGGHGSGPHCTDLLVEADGRRAFVSDRIETANTHGTGCSLSSAITAELAKGAELSDAVAVAHQWLNRAIGAADTLNIGEGHGPVHHFVDLWNSQRIGVGQPI